MTGQDATVEGLQNILAGNQCMTVYKSIREEANALAELAVALINGEEGETTGTVEDTEGGREVPSVLLEPVAIFRDNVKDVVDDEFVTRRGPVHRRLRRGVHGAGHRVVVSGRRGAP